MLSAENAECEGKSRLPSSPRNSIAAKPCCSAKVRIFCKSQAGQPKVEKAIGRRAGFSAGTNAAAITAPERLFAKSRRVVLMQPLFSRRHWGKTTRAAEKCQRHNATKGTQGNGRLPKQPTEGRR